MKNHSGKWIFYLIALMMAGSSRAQDSSYHIYLTFDDGPGPGSKQVDSIIRRKQIKANVFIVGENTRHADDEAIYYHLYKANSFVDIYNHSWTHANTHFKKFYEDSMAVLLDVQKCETELGLQNKIVRLPGRNQWRLKNIRYNDIQNGSSSADLLYENGYKVFGWDLEWVNPGDGIFQSLEKMFKKEQTKTPGHIVLLLHDYLFTIPESITTLSSFIDSVKAHKEYRFEFLKDYPDSPGLRTITPRPD